MKQFLSFVRKEFYHIFRDPRTMLILIAMPIVQIILFGFAISNEVKDVKIGILDPSKDISTERIINRIGSSNYFNIAKIINSPNEIDESFRKGDVNFVIVFEENFQENLFHTGNSSVQLIADGTDPNQAQTITNYISSIIMEYQMEIMQENKIPIQIVPELRMLYNPQMKSAYNFVPGVMGMILMLICAMMTSIAIVREKEMGTMEVLLSSPIKPIYIIVSKAVPYLVLSLVNLTTILLLSVFVLGVPVAGSLFWLGLISILFILVALALGLLISTVSNNQTVAILISGMGLIMPIMLLSGMIFPIESMPTALRWFSTIIPARWYISAIKKLMISGLDVSSVLQELRILIIMAVTLLVLSLKSFKTRLE